MKKILLVFGAILTLNLAAQTPDPNFDQPWVTSPVGYPAKEAVGWISTNLLTHGLASSSNPTSVTQSTVINCSGPASMRIETEKFTTGALGGYVPDTCGFAFTGIVALFPQVRLVDGFAYNQRPTTISYCYKTTVMPGDTSGISVVLWKWTGSTRNYIGGAKNLYLADQTTMTNGVLNVVYSSTVTPDSMCIYAGSSYKFSGTVIRNRAKKGSILWIDNIVYPASTVGVKEQANEIEVNAYPNPANSTFVVATESAEAKGLEIIDLTGKVIERAAFTDGKVKVDVSKYYTGIYLYSVIDKNNQRIKTNKFTVTH
jgi:hypothetical protein